MSDAKPVSIQLLDREYTVGCVAEERDSLLAAAKMLDGKMREIRGGNRMAALDRVAVLAALNLAHDLEQLREETARRENDLSRSFGELNRKLDGLFSD
ncbi:cell division protein ZapA [Lysobacter sp. A03]|uniref:cell division protein ZapA n=1 Tax=Lysobacter sp. A03 TaxID=1199154 RepID=UPI0005B74BBB|nr:cell division protein ZapA [Lysobacter sp. A03]KIQ97814.1 Z-ring-associated protein ZapA [Lysobacter sp. A03]